MLASLLLLTLAGSPAEPAPQVMVVSFLGDAHATQIESAVVGSLGEQGLTVTVAQPGRWLAECDDGLQQACAAALRRGWEGAASAAPFVVLGEARAHEQGHDLRVVVHQRGEPEPVATFEARWVDGDLILPIVFPRAVTRAIEQRRHPPAPITARERQVLAHLDEPPSGDAGAPPLPRRSEVPGPLPPVRSPGDPDARIDLRRDFDRVCRSGRRQRRARGEPRELRPRCSLGPALGYVRPRTWAVASLLVASTLTSIASFQARASGDHSGATRSMLRGVGVATAATAGVLGVGVITLTIGDRWQARRHLQDEAWFRHQE